MSAFDRPPARPDDWTGHALVDIGVNLTDERLAPHLDVLLERARAAGVQRQLVTGTDVDHSRAALELARRFPGELFATAGVHPHQAKDASDEDLTALRALIEAPEVRAVGEAGLDFARDFSPRPDQERLFEAQLALAAETGKPLFLHERDTAGRFLELLRPWVGRVHGVLHCFTGRPEDLDGLLDAGLHVGVTGWVCDERRGGPLQDLVPRIPADRLLVETDAPWLLPRTIRPRPRSRTNEPALLPWVVMRVAGLRGETPETVARTTTANACRLFDLPLP